MFLPTMKLILYLLPFVKEMILGNEMNPAQAKRLRTVIFLVVLNIITALGFILLLDVVVKFNDELIEERSINVKLEQRINAMLAITKDECNLEEFRKKVRDLEKQLLEKSSCSVNDTPASDDDAKRYQRLTELTN